MSIFEQYRKLYDLSGKVALVAGGAGGIGSAISEGLAAFGARVVVCARTRSKVEALAGRITRAGGEALGRELDISDIAAVRQLVDQTASSLGGIDILFNCVGTHKEAPAVDYEEADWDRIIDVNLKYAFFLSQAVARVQVPKGGGKQIHVSSVRSLLGIHRGYVSYCSSKGGLNLMVKQLATEWAGHRITVNAIAPTFTRTELVKKYLEDPDFYNPLVARIPLGRVCEPLDLAGLAIYLASPAADFITGQVIFADGGLTACQ
ncbi:MAG: SDR family oxidoreductase [Bradymonadales bacterium]|nr:SDR family oxidoreductase [Bradymonadales bacterium]